MFCRVFFLDLSEESIKERLTLRRVDPVSGERYMYEDIYWYTQADLNLNAQISSVNETTC